MAYPNAGAAQLFDLVEATLRCTVAPLDGAALCHTHRARELDRILELDALTTSRKVTPSSRSASESCGRSLAMLSTMLTTDTLVQRLATAVASGRTPGNLAVVEGVLTRSLHIPLRDAVLLELRSFVAGLLSCAVRLGRLTAADAQCLILSMIPALEEAGAEAMAANLELLPACCPELEIHAMRHRRSDARSFAS